MRPDPALDSVPPEGSLGLLAYGYRGVVAWRAARGTGWVDEHRQALAALLPAHPVATAQAPDPTLARLTVTVVSGLPRSGTSMLMQMLVAAGMPAYTDAARQADDSNPRGYYEHERVKALARDSGWVPDADGHVVKVVSPLLPHLPPGPAYRVLLLSRNIDEILRSQATMLGALGKSPAAADVLRHNYAQAQARAHAWIRRTPGAAGLAVVHREVLADPLGQSRRIAEFLEGDLSADSMAAAVDAALYRQRPVRPDA